MNAFKKLPAIVKIAILISTLFLAGLMVSLFAKSEVAQSNAPEFTPTRFVTAVINPPTVTPPPPTITAAISNNEIALTFIPNELAVTFVPIDMSKLPTQSPTALPEEVTIEQGQIISNGISVSSLHIFGGGYDYKIEPLANGLFLLGPNKKFLVYFTNNAEVYAGRIGSPYLVEIAKLAYEFPATREGNALFELSLQKNGVIYTLVIYEKRYNSRNSVVIPTKLTE